MYSSEQLFSFFCWLCVFIFPALVFIGYSQLLKVYLRKRAHVIAVGLIFLIIIYSLIFTGLLFISKKKPNYNDVILCSLALEVMYFLLLFNAIHYYYIYSVVDDAQSFKSYMNPIKNTAIVGLYTLPVRAEVFSRLSRWSYFLLGTNCLLFLLLLYTVGKGNEFSDFLLFKVIGAQGCVAVLVFLSCYSFLRMLVKCPNCNLDIFYPDKDFLVYRYIAKRVIKDKVVECYHCHACYALDPDADLEKLRQENIRIHKERKKEIVPQYCW